VSQPSGKRDKRAEAANVDQLAAIDARISQIDKQLAVNFPDFAALVSPKPLSVPGVQSQLHDDEALVLFLDTSQSRATPEETFVWVVTKTTSRWVRSDLGTPSLKRAVATLRCGLDYDGSWGVAGSHCSERLKTTYSEIDHENGKPLPFDLAKAYALYQGLFGQVEDLIKDKQLLVVPSGALTQLPFQVLVTEKPDPALSGTEALRSAAWLIRSHAITVLPSVSSLKALRQLVKDSHASRTLIGFGDPLLDGRPDKYPDDRALALRARASQSCSEEPSHKVASLRGAQRGMLPLKLRSGRVDVAQIRSQVPLPETANELCAVARDLGVSGDDIHLGAHATETEIKQLSESGKLAKYRIMHFATHGALAGQLSGLSEPGLLLTPPDKATETDDGYLSASEVTALKLDADWVILSACNTAAGGAEGAEALSGLARAFFYAGDRALLVSHWSVYSDAAVKLITGAVSRMAADSSIGRAEAMRRSMLALIDKGAPFEAQPAFWAPFVVVGEGAARSQ
jgi:CHAT domain-containing protein